MDHTILIIAGEPSADLHASNLVHAVKQQLPRTHFYGTGGDLMAAAGVELHYHVRDLAVLGLVEVLKHLSFFRKVMRDMIQLAKMRKPDLIILVDYPGFNLRFAAAIKKEMHTPILYYIAPQLWAWGSGRAKKLKRLIDRMAVILPFEKKFFAQYGIKTDYIGHPLVDSITPQSSAEAFRKEYEIPPQTGLLGLLPGSRTQEVRAMLPAMLQAARIIQKATGLQPVIAASTNVPQKEFELPEYKETALLCHNKSYDIMHHATFVLSASGSATLEVAYAGTPLFIMYHVAPITWILGRMLIKLPYIGLANIVAQKQIIPEYLQSKMQPETIARDAIALINNNDRYTSMKKELLHIRTSLGAGTPAQNGAHIVVDMLT